MNDFEAMSIMSKDNMDIRMSSHFVSAKSEKRGGVVSMGVDAKVVNDLFFQDGKYGCALYVVNMEQFNSVKNLLSSEKDPAVFHDCPIHHWFELSYAQYLTIPRSILEAMPHEWKERMTKCLEESDAQIKWRPSEGRYWVKLKNDKGQYVSDPLMQYRHPDMEYIKSLFTEEYPK